MNLLRSLFCAALLCTSAAAAETFYSIPVGDLQIDKDAQWPGASPANAVQFRSPRVVMENGAEAYFLTSATFPQEAPDAPKLTVRSDGPIAGTVYFSTDQFSFGRFGGPMVMAAEDEQVKSQSLHFTATAQSAADAKTDFYRAKAAYYRNLQNLGLPGAAYFRHVADVALRQLPEKDRNLPTSPWWNRPATENDPYDLFTGGRAVSENLQLNRDLRQRDLKGADVDVDSIKGIDVAAMDFRKLVGDANPTLDPLASMVPQDQYAIFFPTPQAMYDVMDKVDASVLPVVDQFMPGGEDAGIAKRYERQLGLERSTVGRLLLNQSVKTVAITGSDPFFPLGTDVALIFQADNPAGLATLLNTQIATAAQKLQVRPEMQKIGQLSVTQYRASDRAISSYVATFSNAVVVANSPVQIQKIAALADGQSLVNSLEYRYFRMQYAINEPESLLLVLPDAAIRKWCSAKWRIADARRIEARAQMLDQIATEISEKKPATAPVDQQYGSRDFMTPIAELDLKTVTTGEAEAYKQWRDNYQRNWRGSFDPIALRLALGKTTISGDLTVIPLIASTEYREFIDVTRNAKLDATSGDPHDDLAHFVLALDRESAPLKQAAAMGDSFTGMKIDLLGWLGKSVAIYADDDPFWDDLQAAGTTLDSFMEKNYSRLPVALRVDSTSPLKLAAFLATVRTKIEQSAPGLTVWENLEYAGKPYVKVSSGPGSDEHVAVYYAALPDSLTITMSEPLLRRSLDRAANKAAAPANPWLGNNIGLRVKSNIANVFARAGSEGREVQQASWRNIPILNEWKRLAPDEDPVALHQRAWGVKLLCPAGGRYVWNDKLQTMQSTAAGCPEAPKAIARRDLVMNQFTAGDFGLSFENGGVRARMILDSDPAKARKPMTRPATTAPSSATGQTRVLSEDDLRKQCMSNLRQIGQASLLYANDHKGRLPVTIDQLLEEQLSTSVFICPAHMDAPHPPAADGTINVGPWVQQNSDYVYLGNGGRMTDNSDRILAYEKTPRHGKDIPTLFLDGHVEQLTPEQLQQRLPK